MKEKLTKEEKLQIVELAKKYTSISNNIQQYSKELKEVQDLISNETELLTQIRKDEQEFMNMIKEKYGEVPDALTFTQIISESK